MNPTRMIRAGRFSDAEGVNVLAPKTGNIDVCLHIPGKRTLGIETEDLNIKIETKWFSSCGNHVKHKREIPSPEHSSS